MGYVSREHFSSYSGVSQEEFLLRHHPLANVFSSDIYSFSAATPNLSQKK
jgi:hypothetical protein